MATTSHGIEARAGNNARSAWCDGPIRTAVVAGFFCLVVCAAMLWWQSRGTAEDPLKSTQLLALKDKLLANPKDAPLKEQIRNFDLEVRRRYLRQLVVIGSGRWLALGAFAAFLLAAKQAMPSRLPQPPSGSDTDFNPADDWACGAARARWAVAGAGTLVGIGLVTVAIKTSTALPADSRLVEKLLANAAGGSIGSRSSDFASVEEMRQNWPRFRGPDGAGTFTQTNLPLTWDGVGGKGLLWKSPLKAAGFNSPIVWGERVFLSGGDAGQREVICYGAARGELLWEHPVREVAGSPAQMPEVPEQTGFAASTMATDGRRVYAIFANGDLVALSLDGKPVWAKNLGIPKNPHGHASSLATWEDRLLVQWDQGEGRQNLSRFYAMDGATGRMIWQTSRPVSCSWATPIVVQAAGNVQIVTLGAPWVIAYAAKDGAELWRVEGLNNEVTPSPIFSQGLVLAVSPNEKLLAIRPDGQGNVTSSHIAWAAEDNIPDISSPVSDGQLAFTLSTPGMLTCYDLKDGKKQWEQDLAMECNASPSLVGPRLYAISIKGTVLVLEAGRVYRELGRSEVGENIYASPAFAGGKVFLRGVKNLFCFGAGERLAQAD